jgi:hypothetical protein
MRMKEVHKKNTVNSIQVIMYRWQLETNLSCFILHLESLASSSFLLLKNVIVDEGYGSEENYLFAIGKGKDLGLIFSCLMELIAKNKHVNIKKDIKNVKNWT